MILKYLIHQRNLVQQAVSVSKGCPLAATYGGLVRCVMEPGISVLINPIWIGIPESPNGLMGVIIRGLL